MGEAKFNLAGWGCHHRSCFTPHDVATGFSVGNASFMSPMEDSRLRSCKVREAQNTWDSRARLSGRAGLDEVLASVTIPGALLRQTAEGDCPHVAFCAGYIDISINRARREV